MFTRSASIGGMLYLDKGDMYDAGREEMLAVAGVVAVVAEQATDVGQETS